MNGFQHNWSGFPMPFLVVGAVLASGCRPPSDLPDSGSSRRIGIQNVAGGGREEEQASISSSK